MKLQSKDWTALSSFIFYDKKIDISSTTEIKSRYLLIVNFLTEHNLEFNRASFIDLLTYKKENGCKNSYLNNIIKVGKYINEWVLLTYKIDSGCSDISYFKRERYTVDILTPQEVQSIYSLDYPYRLNRKKRNLMFQSFFMLLGLTGMRVGEVLNLRWVDITEQSITINNTKTDMGRIIPNNSLIYSMLLKYGKSITKQQYVFQSPVLSGHLDKSIFFHDLKLRVKYLGMTKRVWFHLFRHSFCVELLKHNDVTMVARIMGHENLSSTLGYSHYLLEDMTSALMTHSLLRQNQSFDDVKKQLSKYLDNLVDKTRNSVHIIDKDNDFTIRIKQR